MKPESNYPAQLEEGMKNEVRRSEAEMGHTQCDLEEMMRSITNPSLSAIRQAHGRPSTRSACSWQAKLLTLMNLPLHPDLKSVECPMLSSAAVDRERQLKGWSHSKKLALILGDKEKLKELSRSRENGASK